MPASFGVHGPGGEYDRPGLGREHLVGRDLVVAVDLARRAELAQVVDEVVREAVVVIDQDQHQTENPNVCRSHGRRRDTIPAFWVVASGQCESLAVSQ